MKIAEIIKYEGDNTTFVWKHPCEDFATTTQLIVHESQEALFFLNGQALDLFGPGRHTLETQNIPLLRKVANIPTGGDTPFHCEVYFINKTEQMAINWGMGDVNYLDPTNNDYPFKIGASGEMTLRISDSRKIILKLVGTERSLDQETIKKYFKSLITTNVKSVLPNIFRERNVSIFEVESFLPELSDILKKKLSEEMDDYGVTLEKFWVNTVQKPERDPFYLTLARQRGEKVSLVHQGEIDIKRADYERQKELVSYSGAMQKKRMEIDAKRYEQQQLGYTYQQQRGFDVMEKIAENEGSGSDLRNAAMGLGMGFGVGGVFGDALQNISQNTMQSSLSDPVPAPPTGFSPIDGEPQMIGLKTEQPQGASGNEPLKASGGTQDFKGRLDKLVMMKEAGVLSDEEFDVLKRKLIAEIMG